MSPTCVRLALLGLLILAGGWRLPAQDEPDDSKPKPAAKSLPGINTPDAQDDNGTPWAPDTGPLTGMQTPTVGHPELKHSYWVPGVIYGLTVQKTPGGNSSGWYANNYFGGNVSLLEEKSRSELALNASAGGFLSSGGGQGNGWFSQMGLAETYNWQRLQLQIFDQFSYLPETQSGFGGGTGLGIPGIGGSLGPTVPGIGGPVIPGQNIYAAAGPRYSNSLVVQSTYSLSRRSSITFGGSDGILRFTQSGNIDSDTYYANLGYNYQLTKTDSIGLQYRFTSIHYSGLDQAYGDHAFNVAYGRKITQRLALQLSGGPDLTTYRVPIGNQSQRLTGSASANLSYLLANGAVSLSYFHGISAGGGVLLGSTTDNFTLGYDRRLTRLWSTHMNFGYARNSPIAAQTGISSSPYNDWLAGVAANRPIGRNASLGLGYTARIETTNQTGCTGTGCYTGFTQHIVTVSLEWHTNPFVLP